MSIRIITGDCRAVLAEMPGESVHMVVTSPPYFGLRDYGVAGQIGLEATPDEYVAALVEVFRGVHRVLRDDGTLWLNIGDCYASGSSGDRNPGTVMQSAGVLKKLPARAPVAGLKPKDLVGIPWMLAFALRNDGWYLRSDIIWAKRNCMPESVRDRPTSAHEHIFLLTKQARYFYDAIAIEEDSEIPAGTRAAKGSAERSGTAGINSRPPEYAIYTGKRNKRSVWWMATQPFPEGHFAVFPDELPETCIKAGTSERGVCPQCGAPWERDMEVESRPNQDSSSGHKHDGTYHRSAINGRMIHDARWRIERDWRPTCSCPPHKPVPATVLDPFGGAGTTGLVADRLGRNAILIDLNPGYRTMSKRRIENDAPLFVQVAVE